MSPLSAFENTLASGRDWQRDLYIHFHQNPELSMQEEETAARIERELADMGLETQRIGTTGVVAVIENGQGPVLLSRADIDALPVTEQTGLEYASQRDGVMHACGHDFHMTSLLGAVRALLAHREAWSGTLIALFQPGEETAEGAQAMVDDDLVSKIPKPDVAVAQHVLPGEAGVIGVATGPILSQGDSMRVTIYGKGSHGSMPHLAIDPVVIASSIVVRLQSVVSRVVAPSDFSVVTVGAINAGTKSNIIPDTAELMLNLRHYDPEVRTAVLAAVERIIRAECEASGCEQEPDIEYYDQFPLTHNSGEVTDVLRAAFTNAFGEERVFTQPPATASEDFSRIPDAFGIPYSYWTVGGFEKGSPMPGNHSPFFGPVLQPTLDAMTQAQVVAALAVLGRPSEPR